MAQIREIKSRMKAVANIRRITKTMQMIATSKFARAEQRAVAARPFTLGVFDLVRELAATAGDLEHPLISGVPAGAGKPELLLVITSDRGLCGPYNGAVLRAAMDAIRSASRGTGVSPVIELVGKKGVAFLRFKGVRVAKRHEQFGDNPQREDADALADSYMRRFIAGEVSAVRVVSMRYESAGRQKPDALQLLPLTPPTAAGEAKKSPGLLYEFSPPAEELLATLLPVTVRATLNQLFNEAAVSEHVARMVAMKAATDNAGKMGNTLKRQFNRARQAQITTELTEIISGAAALE
ncbi:MAG: ATP synthase F1 subunit gamma [Planctomycetota bacterium]|nr:MAG: ATP synthase F1 subunit gamma [Planctomycetota bacterium]